MVIVSIVLASHLSEVNVGDKCMSLWITGCTRTCGDHLLSLLLLLRERLLIPAVDIVLCLESVAGCQAVGESEGRREGRRLPCPAAGSSPFPSPHTVDRSRGHTDGSFGGGPGTNTCLRAAVSRVRKEGAPLQPTPPLIVLRPDG